MLHLTNDMDLVAKGILVPEKGTELLNARPIQQPGEPELDCLAGELVRTEFEIPGNFIGIAVHDPLQQLVYFIIGLFVRSVTGSYQFLFHPCPESRLIGRVDSPSVSFYPLLLAIYSSLDFVSG